MLLEFRENDRETVISITEKLYENGCIIYDLSLKDVLSDINDNYDYWESDKYKHSNYTDTLFISSIEGYTKKLSIATKRIKKH